MSTLSPETEEKSFHHPGFYFPDGTVIFKLTSRDCPGVLYNLHHGLLAQRSTFFTSLFSLPRGPTFLETILLDFDMLLTWGSVMRLKM
ncbi:hypothetical protein B0H13DRAFT_2308121 [Mycena leptocephala]|nr:hypothetical protein B0H13DRAFT_2308121 [Mycena leptocephala]